MRASELREKTNIEIYFEEKFSEEDKKIVKDHVEDLGETHSLIFEDKELTSIRVKNSDIEYLWDLLERIDCTFDINIETSIEGFMLTPKRPSHSIESKKFFEHLIRPMLLEGEGRINANIHN